MVAQQLQSDSSCSLCLQVLIYPICEAPAAETASMTKYASGYFFTKDTLDWTTSLYLKEDHSPNAMISPLLGEVAKNLAPAIFIVAECDVLQDQAIQYVGKLKSAGVPVDCHFYYGMPHAFVAMAGTLELGEKALCECVDRLAVAFDLP